jgi:hypothetical protein
LRRPFVWWRGNFFKRQRLFVELGVERFRPHYEKLGSGVEQRAGVLITRTERRNGRFDAAVFQLKIADVGDRAAVEPRAQVGD